MKLSWAQPATVGADGQWHLTSSRYTPEQEAERLNGVDGWRVVDRLNGRGLVLCERSGLGFYYYIGMEDTQ